MTGWSIRSDELPPPPDTLRFSAHAQLFGNLVADARKGSRVVRLKALRELELLLVSPADAVYAVGNSPLLELLTESVANVDADVALLGSACLAEVCAQRWTRKRALETGLLAQIFDCIAAADARQRLNGYRAAVHCARDGADARLLVEAQRIERLVGQVGAELAGGHEQNLLSLCGLLAELALLPDAAELLAAAGAIEALEPLLVAGQELCRAGLELLGLLALSEAGRKAAVAVGLPGRVDAQRGRFQPRAALAAACLLLLAALAKHVPTKRALVGSGCALFALETAALHLADERATVNALLALAELAEEPRGRAQLLERAEQIGALARGASPGAAEQVGQLLRAVAWQP